MLKHLRGYLSEIFILIAGAAAALVQALLTDDRNLLVIVITLLPATTTIRIEVRNRLQDDLGRVLADILHPQWHEDARLRIDQLRAELREWAEGRRVLVGRSGLAYQIDVVRRTRRSLDAIHLALAPRSLQRWDKETGEFSEFVEAHSRSPTGHRGNENGHLCRDFSVGTAGFEPAPPCSQTRRSGFRLVSPGRGSA
jgi:hypothetical protein